MREYYVDGPTMKAVDTHAIKSLGIPSMVLMERAAYEVAQVIFEHYSPEEGPAVILAGMGNNGADGLAVARMLTDRGYHAKVLAVGRSESATDEWKIQYQILEKLDIPVLFCDPGTRIPQEILNLIQNPNISLFVDGLFGIGLSRDLTGIYVELIQLVNASNRPVVAIDIPSGVLSSTGQIAKEALRCSYTVTFGRKKLGTILYPGAAYCGQLLCKDVGFTRQALAYPGYQAWGFGKDARPSSFGRLLIRRPKDGHKGTFGKLLLIAGCDTMAGAAVFAAGAAMRMGCGLVKVHTPEVNRDVILSRCPEAILSLYESGKPDSELITRDLQWADAIVFGPGMGQADYVYSMLKMVLFHCFDHRKLLVLDADGLRCLAAHEDLWVYVKGNVILTPHMGEMAALTGKSIGELQRNQIASCKEFASERECICIMKQATPIICAMEEVPCVVTSGCNALGTAGSGDVLSGILGALCGEGYEGKDAAYLGAHIHGLVGSHMGKVMGNRSVCASDLLDGIAEVMKLLDE